MLPSTLEKMLQRALKSSPDIRMAEASVRQAEAELDRARLAVTRMVVKHHYELRKLERVLKAARTAVAEVEAKMNNGVASREEQRNAAVQALEAESGLEQVRSDLRFLLGLRRRILPRPFDPSAGLPWDLGIGTGNTKRQVFREQSIGPGGGSNDVLGMNWHHARTLNENVVLDSEGKRVKDVLSDLVVQAGGHKPGSILKLVYHRQAKIGLLKELKVDLRLGKVTLRGALQALADNYGLAFVVRSYGILVTTPEAARSYQAAFIIR